jgi:hypothetical protein
MLCGERDQCRLRDGACFIWLSQISDIGGVDCEDTDFI